jgi:hypothetical protein
VGGGVEVGLDVGPVARDPLGLPAVRAEEVEEVGWGEGRGCDEGVEEGGVMD